jgi:hypothetical protein
VRITVQEFVHQAHAEEAGSAGDEDVFVSIHAETGLGMRTTRRPANDDLGAPTRRKELCIIIVGEP